jgi:hypothetical protein
MRLDPPASASGWAWSGIDRPDAPADVRLDVLACSCSCSGDGWQAGSVHLCGQRFSPVRDPRRFPVCPRCKELAGMLGIGG